ncbi:hypothetical protein EVAR_23688_1 [Eumeta japonica]|uniref:Uncharacterized protein n=1 Tax=Eumeta variegata TaxID=151549 RepID=A0A4C1VIY1_EUMVA|nr:hypothetical protein EVAR_23688_1 [Eumeta japonica]
MAHPLLHGRASGPLPGHTRAAAAPSRGFASPSRHSQNSIVDCFKSGADAPTPTSKRILKTSRRKKKTFRAIVRRKSRFWGRCHGTSINQGPPGAVSDQVSEWNSRRPTSPKGRVH